MKYLILTSLLLILSMITYQDCKERQVNWILFPVAFFLSIVNSLRHVTADKLLLDAGLNAIMIAILFLFLLMYTKIRFKGQKGLWQLIGVGDLLLFVLLSVNFALLNFVLFCLISLIVSLGTSVFYKYKTIPLAGVQASCLSFALLLQEIAEMNLFNEYWIYQWM